MFGRLIAPARRLTTNNVVMKAPLAAGPVDLSKARAETTRKCTTKGKNKRHEGKNVLSLLSSRIKKKKKERKGEKKKERKEEIGSNS